MWSKQYGCYVSLQNKRLFLSTHQTCSQFLPGRVKFVYSQLNRWYDHKICFLFPSDALVRQAAMVIKCIILMCYKNSKGRTYRKQVRQYKLSSKKQKVIMLSSPKLRVKYHKKIILHKFYLFIVSIPFLTVNWYLRGKCWLWSSILYCCTVLCFRLQFGIVSFQTRNMEASFHL